MTEATWLISNNPLAMLQFILPTASTRKLRLFGCACCRWLWALFTDDRCRRIVEAAEQVDDGLLNGGEFASGEAHWFWIKDAARQAFHAALGRQNKLIAGLALNLSWDA